MVKEALRQSWKLRATCNAAVTLPSSSPTRKRDVGRRSRPPPWKTSQVMGALQATSSTRAAQPTRSAEGNNQIYSTPRKIDDCSGEWKAVDDVAVNVITPEHQLRQLSDSFVPKNMGRADLIG